MNAIERKEQRDRLRAAYEKNLAAAKELYPIGTVATCDPDDDPVPVTGRVTGYIPDSHCAVLVILDGTGKDGTNNGWAAYLHELR
jgi:hypothetical protein